jgi:hypothetical protein
MTVANGLVRLDALISCTPPRFIISTSKDGSHLNHDFMLYAGFAECGLWNVLLTSYNCSTSEDGFR